VRVAWLGPQPLDGGGVPRLGGLLLESLAAAGLDVDAYFAVGAPDQLRTEEPGSSLRLVTTPIDWKPGGVLGRWPLVRFATGQRARAVAQARLIDTLVASHRKRPYDVVYQFSQFELLGLRRARGSLPPIVVHPETHAAGELRWMLKEVGLARESGGLPVWAGATAMLRTRSAIQRRDAGLVAGVIAPSQRFAEHLGADYRIPADRLHVIPNAIDLDRFSPPEQTPTGPIRILFVSRMAVRKGVDMVVALSHRLADLEGKVVIEAVGNQSLWSDYRPLLGNLNPAVGRYRAHVAPDVLAQLFSETDLLVQPSYFEPFALTVAEALASGIPVVASDEVGATEGVDRRCCRTFPAGDLDAFERAVRAAVATVRSPEGVEARAIAASEAQRLFSPARVAGMLTDVLSRVSDSG
jgi:glycosyltransferase involved in cell wall biosynthesis